MHVVVIGAGSIGKRHLANLDKLEVENLSVVDPQFERRREAKDAVKRANTTAILAMAIKGRKADAVIIAVPTHLHVPVAMEAAQLGVPLFIEKPVGHLKDDVLHLETLLRNMNNWAVVGYSLRFHQALGIIRGMLEQHTIGKILSVRAEVGQYLPDWHPAEDYRKWYMAKEAQGGGAILDLSHEIDYLRWLFGDIASVSGFVGRVSDLDIDTDDLAELVCWFKSGVIGSIHMDLIQRAYHRGCRIVGSEGTITWDYNEAAVKCYTAKDKQWRSQNYTNDRNVQFMDEMRAFLSKVRGETISGVERLCSFAEARATLDVVLEAKGRCGASHAK